MQIGLQTFRAPIIDWKGLNSYGVCVKIVESKSDWKEKWLARSCHNLLLPSRSGTVSEIQKSKVELMIDLYLPQSCSIKDVRSHAKKCLSFLAHCLFCLFALCFLLLWFVAWPGLWAPFGDYLSRLILLLALTLSFSLP